MSATQRRLTVMFADVSGSTALFEKLGDREAMHAVERCLKRMNRSIDGYKGKTIQIVGDELLASFENAEEACQAAIDMQQRIADLPPVSGLKLTIRIGLHSGVVAVSEGKLGGPAVATAARIAGIRDRLTMLGVLVAASALCAVGGVILSANLRQFTPLAGQSYLMDAIAAVFIGTAFNRLGRVSIAGTLGGVLFLAIIDNGLNLMGLNYLVKDALVGVILVVALVVAAHWWFRRREAKKKE